MLDGVNYYYNTIKHTNLKNTIRMITHKIKLDIEKRNWEIYLVKYQNMTKDNFEEFKSLFDTNKVSKRSTQEILKDVEKIKKKCEVKKHGNI